ncbi:MAG TPA: asparagine synthase-related protein [Trueperaceae bacterium]
MMTLATRPVRTVDERVSWSVTFGSPHGPARFRLEPGPIGVTQLAERRGVRLLFDGYLYDVEDLSVSLAEPGDRSAAELLLRAYEEWGRDLPARIAGEFALVLVDERRRCLFAARDRIGTRPLYYRSSGSGIELGLSVDSFSAPHPGLDPQVIGCSLAGAAPPAHSTPYAALYRLLPGHWLRFDAKGLTTHRYWRPPLPPRGSDWLGREDLPRFDGLLHRAVARAASGRTAILLSGGLDSVSVAATAVDVAAERGLDPPLAISLHYSGETEEPPVQKAVAARLGIEHLTLEWSDALGEHGLLQPCLETAAGSPLPLHNPWRPATDALASLAATEGCRVVLTGSGGDEWLSVDALVVADYLRSGNLLGLVRYLASVGRSQELSWIQLLKGVVWRKGVRPLLDVRRLPGAAGRGSRNVPDWLVPLPAIPARPQAAETVSGFYARAIASLPVHPRRMLEIDEKFEAARAAGVRQVDVYWDADLVEFLCRVPPHLLFAGGRSKALAREKLARRFPGMGFERQKKVVRRHLLAQTILGEGSAAWRRLGGAPALAQLGLVKSAQLEEFVRGSLATSDPHSVDALWRIFSLEAWARPRV